MREIEDVHPEHGFDRTGYWIGSTSEYSHENDRIGYGDESGSRATAAQAEGPTDPQIAAIRRHREHVDIDAGKLAISKSHRKDVRELAPAHDHGPHRGQQVRGGAVTKLKVTPEDNATSQSLKAGGEQNLHNLKTLKGAAFDKAYVDHEVAYHEQVLGAVDTVLIPNAANAELKPCWCRSARRLSHIWSTPRRFRPRSPARLI